MRTRRILGEWDLIAGLLFWNRAITHTIFRPVRWLRQPSVPVPMVGK